MAFRKTVRSDYRPSISVHLFGDSVFQNSRVEPSSSFVSRDFMTAKDISKTSLPLTSLDALLSTGKLIDGSTSFAPSDPALIESSVHSVVGSYVSQPVKSSDPVE